MPLKEERPGYWRGELWHQGRRVRLTFRGTAKEARLYEAQKRIEAEKSGIIHARQVPTFEEFLDDKYEPHAKQALRKSTNDTRKYQFKPLKRHFGALRLTKITEQHIAQYKQKRRAEKIGKVTINGELNVLSAILTYARDELKVPCANPKIKRFKVRPRRGKIQSFTREEVTFILTAARRHYEKFYPVVLFLFETGVRKSEAINLPWSNIVFDQRIARIWSFTRSDDDEDDDEDEDDDGYMVKSIEREVPLPDHVILMLKELKLGGLSPTWVFPATTDRCHTKGERYRFFPKYTWIGLLAKATELRRAPLVGELMNGGASKDEARQLAAEQIPAIKGGPHKARHTYASHFLAAKADLFLLGRVLGHTHSRVTELYSHLLPDHLAAARGVVNFIATPPGLAETPPVTPPAEGAAGEPRRNRQ